MKKQREESPPLLHFKGSHQGQSWVFPPHLGDLIEEDHPVRMINRFVDELDVTDILLSYTPGGTSCYHPKVLINLFSLKQKVETDKSLSLCGVSRGYNTVY